MVRNWLKLKSRKVLQIFLDFANFYYSFIQGFGKSAGLFIPILKTISLSKNSLISKNLIENDKLIVGSS